MYPRQRHSLLVVVEMAGKWSKVDDGGDDDDDCDLQLFDSFNGSSVHIMCVVRSGHCLATGVRLWSYIARKLWLLMVSFI